MTNRILTTLAALRQKRGYTQIELAKKVSISQPLLSYAEAGYMELSPHIAERLARILEIDPEDLLSAYEDFLQKKREKI